MVDIAEDLRIQMKFKYLLKAFHKISLGKQTIM